MPKYTVRVELHGADAGDYDKLHEAMKAEGFTQTIQFDGVRYHLPTAEYNFSGPLPIKMVLHLARIAASKTEREYSLLITELGRRLGHNLRADVE